MLKILSKFFAFCQEENRRKFQKSIALGIIQALFEALKIPAIFVVLKAIVEDNVSNTTIWASFGIMLLSIIGGAIAKYFATMLQCEGGYGTCADKRMDIAKHLRYLPMGFFNKNSLGSIVSVTTNTMENLENVATRVVMLVTQGLLTTVLIVLMLFIFDWRIALILLAGFLVFLLINSQLQKVSENLSVSKIENDTKLIEKVMEYIQGITEVKTYKLIGTKSKELNDASKANVESNIAMELKLIPYMTAQNFVIKITGVLMIMASILLYLHGTMSLLICLGMIISAFIVYSSLETAGSYSALLRTVDICVDRADEILKTPQMDIKGSDIVPLIHTLSAEHISFAYNQRKVIDNVSLVIPQKTTTAIVGPSGSGKTTLVNLLSRFWDIDEGKISLDGHNIKDYSIDALMKNFSFVFQDVFLFHDTIANNIRFGQPDASIECVQEAAKKACCHDFIMNLPDGYDTIIDEDGSSLSGGERQRISIARAIMKDAPIIIMDEATANVDPENEAELIRAIEALTQEKTVIMIAHRLKTVRNADQILVVDAGHIVQQGTHTQLIAQEGIYKDFVSDRKQSVSWKL